MNAKEFVAKLVDDNQALFQASRINVKAYFDSKPSQQELVEHFVGRMVNERMNMVEISTMVEIGNGAKRNSTTYLMSYNVFKHYISSSQTEPVNTTRAFHKRRKLRIARGFRI